MRGLKKGRRPGLEVLENKTNEYFLGPSRGVDEWNGRGGFDVADGKEAGRSEAVQAVVGGKRKAREAQEPVEEQRNKHRHKPAAKKLAVGEVQQALALGWALALAVAVTWVASAEHILDAERSRQRT